MPYRPPPLGPKHLHVTGPARADIDDALAYLAADAGLQVALDFADRIDELMFRLADIGHSGVSREWLSPGLRMTAIGRYCVYFRVTQTETRIIRFLHGSRDVSAVVFGDADT
ncbi:MAG: type II toxin-antitoxin system RelE/ParE family toxin [Hyphomicrobium sp.]